MTNEKPWKRHVAEPGFGLCPSCGGQGWCWFCYGTGSRLGSDDKRCSNCRGKGFCPVCEGDGQLTEEAIEMVDGPASKS
jgi:hypothetical protein